MISLNKFMTEVKNKLQRLDEKHNIKESISLNGTWTAPLVCRVKYPTF